MKKYKLKNGKTHVFFFKNIRMSDCSDSSNASGSETESDENDISIYQITKMYF